ncbi:MAG: chromosome segregation protein SMC [Lachnospiraceae bacterium]|nr:chromosome segregation protein SMC [Lachnospiraceae bacterium]
MYLKKIEIQGFKSFANKTVFEFTPGITGIVGPNGSGKSNVADAVRWVLGEQSAKSLRGSSMQDVIFAGTEVRKPQGFASVTLTLDNADRGLSADYDEIVVTRKAFRSGESEYRMNGSVCRLRDIHEMFYDTGVGREGYSIIGQGQVDKILSSKPEERRELFDEAAGIVKQRKRKDAAIKKLEDEQNSILRVKDVIGEMEHRLGPLTKQAETAKTYLNLRDELKTYEVGAFFKESEDVTKKLSAADERIAVLEGDIQESKAALEKQRADYEEITAERERLESQIEEERELFNRESVRKQSAEGQIALLEEQIGALKKGADENKNRLITLEEDYKKRQEERQQLVEEKGKVNIAIDEMDDALTEDEEKLDEADDQIRILEHKLEKAQNELFSNTSERERLAADEQRIRTERSQLTERREAAEAGLEKAKEAAEAAAAKIGECDEKLEELEQKESEAADTLAGLRAAVEQEESCRDGLQQQLSETFRLYQAARSRLETLSALAERYDGYGESIKRVMDRKKDRPEIRGVVADIIRTEKKYELAIETALGGKIQNIVVEKEDTAKELIEYLKKNRYGRATFLPMDAVRGDSRYSRREALEEKGALGSAADLVQAAPEYAGIISSLLGRIQVVDNMDNAVAIARKYGYSINMVTLDGEHLSPGGAITGGAFRSNANLLGRGRQIADLKKEAKKHSEEAEEIKKHIAACEASLSARTLEADAANEALYALKIEQTEMTAKRSQLKAEEERQNAAKKAGEEELKSIAAQLLQLSYSQQKAEEETALAREKDEKRRTENETAGARLEQLRTDRQKLAEEISGKKQEYTRLTERDSFLLQNIRRLTAEAEALRKEKEELVKKGDPDGIRISEKMAELAAAKEVLEEADEAQKRSSARLKGAITRRDNYNRRQKEMIDERESSNERITALEKDLFRVQSQRERAQEAFDALVQNIWDEYGLTPEEAERLQYDGNLSLAELRRRIKQKRDEIKALGPVNVNAIEEERELSERYTFLTGQYNDLLAARDALLNIIEELENGMRKQFEKNFRQIRKEFNTVFRDLFGGGIADLQLIREEGQDLLDSGVSVIAQPPGKKLQNMMQLSGGEKALTAIALIFAIQNLKPSPFCLVDEIEAALDEPNVDRFANYLKRLKANTQIIAITHRRGTMQAAETLYGITMQEKGVSIQVSVDLSDPQYND